MRFTFPALLTLALATTAGTAPPRKGSIHNFRPEVANQPWAGLFADSAGNPRCSVGEANT